MALGMMAIMVIVMLTVRVTLMFMVMAVVIIVKIMMVVVVIAGTFKSQRASLSSWDHLFQPVIKEDACSFQFS